MEPLNALVLFSNFVLLPGLVYGCQLALGALGLTLVFAVLRFSNIAHGDLMAFGTGMTILATWGLQALGVSLGPLPTALLALPLGMVGAALLSLGTDRVVYAHFRAVRSPPIVFLILSIGVMFIYNGVTRLLIGVEDIRFSDGVRFVFTVRDFRTATGLDEGLGLRTTQLLTMAVTALAVTALFLFLARTRTGKAMRAFADNEDLARLSGIDPGRVVALTWLLAAALATLAGTLYGLDKSFKAFTYFNLLLPIFAAAILGGFGNPVGAVLGGFIVAFSEGLLTYVYRKLVTYLVPFEPDGLLQILSTEYKFAVSFVILVAVLLIRPTGLTGART